MCRCYDLEVSQFILSSGMVNRTLSPDMWQVVFSHISVQCRVVYSDVNGLLDGSGNAMTLSSNYSKVPTDVLWPVLMSCSRWVKVP